MPAWRVHGVLKPRRFFFLFRYAAWFSRQLFLLDRGAKVGALNSR